MQRNVHWRIRREERKERKYCEWLPSGYVKFFAQAGQSNSDIVLEKDSF